MINSYIVPQNRYYTKDELHPLGASVYPNNTRNVSPQSSSLANGDSFEVLSPVLKGLGGAIACYKLNGQVASAYKETFDDMRNGSSMGECTKSLMHLGFEAAGCGALSSGGVSAIVNGYKFATGKINGAEAAGNIAAETVSGVVTSVSAVAVGGAVTAMAGKFMSGLSLGILGMGAGIIGSVVADHYFKKVGAYDGLKGLFKA